MLAGAAGARRPGPAAMMGLVNDVARFVGYLVLVVGGLGATARLCIWHRVSNDVSERAKEMAAAADPNNPVERAAWETMSASVLESMDELRPDETIEADPQPILHLDWSVDDGSAGDIEAVVRTLERAGYHTHPFPEVSEKFGHNRWSDELAGVWISEPEWHTVQYDGRDRDVGGTADVQLPENWTPDGGQQQ